MISVMSDFDLDRKHDVSKPRVSENDVDFRSEKATNGGSSDRGLYAEMMGSEETSVSLVGNGLSLDSFGSKQVTVSSDSDDGVRAAYGVVDDLEGRTTDEVGVSGADCRVIDGEMELKTRETENEVFMLSGSGNKFSDRNAETEHFGSQGDHKFDVGYGGMEHLGSSSGKGHVDVGKYDSMLSMFDEFVANESSKDFVVATSPMGYGLEIGDMVWGKVKSHPWWPGHIFSEEFASPSVRRSKREGHVLVAFFGDSSYGWFEPAELVPFDSHFAEKSQQTNLRSFAKAVEEAVDEASRRSGLGLVCRCRNPYNFRPTNAQGYYAVDVADYERGTVYSLNQIRKARESFQPKETLAFVKQLALMPRVAEHPSLGFVKNKATVFAYRKAVFEEFDETYAQAFGMQPVRPSRGPPEAVAQPSRAPLSGPMVIAEALGKGKSASKPVKTKDQAKKDRYLLKRRDERDEVKAQLLQPGQATSSLTLDSGDYVLQKRSPTVSVKPQTLAKHEHNVSKVDPTAIFPVGQTSGYNGFPLESKPSVDKGKDDLLEFRESSGHEVVVVPISVGVSGSEVSPGETDNVPHTSEHEGGRPIGLKHERQSVKKTKLVKDLERSPNLGTAHQEQDGRKGSKKTKILKRPVSELGTDRSAVVEKKKKRKKEVGSSDRTQKHVATEKGGPKEEFQVDHQKKNGGPSTSLFPDSVGLGNVVLELPQLLRDLQALALNPFHHTETNSPAVVRHVFLKFRSLVYHYQKSLSLLPEAETEPNEVHPTKYPDGIVVSDNAEGESSRDLPVSKPSKPSVRPDDPSKGGRKRGPSDRQEEMSAKRLKKIKQLKTLTGEKKAVEKSPEAQPTGEKKAAGKTPEAPRRDGKEPVVAPIQPKPVRFAPTKKSEPAARVSDPTTLVMKFTPFTNLPSGSELKARLARFGPLDHSGTRVFYKSSTCRVVYRYKADAHAAHKHLMSNSSLFGNTIQRCFIRDSASESEPAETPPIEQRLPAVPLSQPLHQQPAIQLKSCLKKSTVGDESTGVNGGRGTTPRVKFMLGGEDNRMVGNKNNSSNNASFADGGSSSTSSHAMDFNSKNFQKVIPSLPKPIIIPISKAPINMHVNEVEPRNTQNFSTLNDTPPAAHSTTTTTTNVEFAQKMLSILNKCNDVVSNVESFLGYMPYHPL